MKGIVKKIEIYFCITVYWFIPQRKWIRVIQTYTLARSLRNSCMHVNTQSNAQVTLCRNVAVIRKLGFTKNIAC